MSLKEIISKPNSTISELQTEEWGLIYIRSLPADDYYRLLLSGKNSSNDAVKALDTIVGWVVASVVDKDGKPEFSADDIPLLKRQPGRVLDKIAQHSVTCNASVEKAKENF